MTAAAAYHCQVGGGFGEALEGGAHTYHAGGASQDSLNRIQHHCVFDIGSGLRNEALEGELCTRIGVFEFLEHVVENLVHLGGRGFHLGGGQQHVGSSLERDCVTERSGVYSGHLCVVFLDQRQQGAGDDLAGIGPVERDVHARMTALQALHADAEGLVALGSLHGLVGEVADTVQSAGAADAELALVLGVEVQEDVALEEAGTEFFGSGHAGFFVVGDEHFHGAVGKLLVFHNCHCKGNADAVVGTESGSLGTQPFTEHFSFDGIGEEIVLGLGGLLRHHVHVSLQDNAAAVLVTLGCGSAHDHVSGFVCEGVDTFLLSPLQQECAHFFLVLRGTRLTGQKVEIVPNVLRFKIFDC